MNAAEVKPHSHAYQICCASRALVTAQVVGTFLESGSADKNAAMRKDAALSHSICEAVCACRCPVTPSGTFPNLACAAPAMHAAQVVGTFLESGSADENAAMRKVALARPDAPSAAVLAEKGAAFAIETVA